MEQPGAGSTVPAQPLIWPPMPGEQPMPSELHKLHEYYVKNPSHPFMMMMPQNQIPQSQPQVPWNPSMVPLQGHPQQYYPQFPPLPSLMKMMMMPQNQMPQSQMQVHGMDVPARCPRPLDPEERRKRRWERFRKNGLVFDRDNDGSSLSDDEMFIMLNNKSRHEYAKIALKFYERSQDAEFEMVDALHSAQSYLSVPGASSEHSTLPNTNILQEWCHVSFIAKPKNTDCNDASPKYFFAELVIPGPSRIFDVKYCYKFEPSNDLGFEHGCVFCPADQKFHPGVGGYRVGAPPCSVVKTLIR